jgi:hypothetical protein
MTIAVYVAEIDGRGVAAFNAEHITEAEQLIESPWFKDDLYEFGWNGKSSIFLRNPYPEEREKFELSWAKATRAGDVDEGGTWLLWLVPAELTDGDEDVDDD